jgi:hypothetical protein
MALVRARAPATRPGSQSDQLMVLVRARARVRRVCIGVG